ncbi:hypothetical protein IQ62_19110 [Streptomyces scabiei]|nr:hypothetical protein IQ62_19110 [Streptomyces scabiei]
MVAVPAVVAVVAAVAVTGETAVVVVAGVGRRGIPGARWIGAGAWVVGVVPGVFGAWVVGRWATTGLAGRGLGRLGGCAGVVGATVRGSAVRDGAVGLPGLLGLLAVRRCTAGPVPGDEGRPFVGVGRRRGTAVRGA